LGTAGLGITVSNRLSPFTTLPRTAKSSTQAADGLGQTNDKASAAMVAEANDGCGYSSFAALNCWALCQMSRPVHIITRLRLDAQLYRPAPLRRSKQMGRPRKVGAIA